MNPLQRAAVRRKVGYFAAILALFTLSIFWRGDERRLLAVPFSTGDRPAANAGKEDGEGRILCNLRRVGP